MEPNRSSKEIKTSQKMVELGLGQDVGSELKVPRVFLCGLCDAHPSASSSIKIVMTNGPFFSNNASHHQRASSYIFIMKEHDLLHPAKRTTIELCAYDPILCEVIVV